jgi:hypothetical protein
MEVMHKVVSIFDKTVERIPLSRKVRLVFRNNQSERNIDLLDFNLRFIVPNGRDEHFSFKHPNQHPKGARCKFLGSILKDRFPLASKPLYCRNREKLL